MTEQPNTTPEDGAVELVATVTFRWTYMAKPCDYGTSDPLEMAKIDAENYRNDPLMYVEGEPVVTVEPTVTERVDVVITEVGATKINVIKALRGITGMGLYKAAQLTNSVPTVVRSDIAAADAVHAAASLRNQGATVELRPHAAPSTAERSA